MFASLALFAILSVIMGFYGLCRLMVGRIEGGTYEEPMSDSAEWSASLDVAIGVDYFSTTEEDQVDMGWDMVPMVDAWAMVQPTTTVIKKRASKRVYSVHTVRALREMCYV